MVSRAQFYRKIMPRIADARVVSKNRLSETPNYYNTPQAYPIVDRLKPGRGYMHLLRKRDVFDFVSLLPDWAELSEGLDAIVLSEGSEDLYGWHIPGIVHVCAWTRELWESVPYDAVEECRELLERLEVPVEKRGSHYLIRWTRNKARAFQLLEVLLHELGHHHDRINTRSQDNAARGEPYADDFAVRQRDLIWDDFVSVFDID